MAALDFPTSGLTAGVTTYTANGQTWVWNGVAWDRVPSISLSQVSNWPTAVSTTEVGFLDGVTSAIQTQLDGKAAGSHTHSYLPLSGGTMTGTITFAGAQTWPTFNQNTTGSAGSVAWTGVTGKPTTVSGYGITNALVRGGGIGNIDFNAQRTLASGIYSVDAAPTNGPPSSAYSNFIQMYERGDTAAQLVIEYSTGRMYSRGIQTAAPSYSAWRTQIDDGNYNSYSPTLTGGGASGTWGINVTGSSASCTGNAATASTAATVNATSAQQNGDGWWRSTGATGWYSTTYAVGIYATEATNVRTYNGANFIAAGNVTAYSDIRLKENIEVIPNALEKVMALEGVTFTRNDMPDTEKRHTGVIAQQVLEVLPEAVSLAREDDYYTVAYGNMVGLLIEAIKEQQKQIEVLMEKVNG